MGKPGKKSGKGMLAPTNPSRRTDPTKTNLRDQRTIRRLKMYVSKIKRDEKGNIIKGSVLKASDRVQTQMARISPDRRWFGNTRTIEQDALQKFREVMQAKHKDPYSIIIKQSKLPLSLLETPKNEEGSIRQEMQWEKTFGDKATRKRARLSAVDIETLASEASAKEESYISGKQETDRNRMKNTIEVKADKSKNGIVFTKGQSNRIWSELYKVIDSSDVILYVLDARDPLGTRSTFLEDYMQREKKYKHFVLVLNKCDLIPLWATARWLQILSKDYPTIAFHASVNHPFGKGNVISLLRQFSKLHNTTHRGSKRTKTPISVGIIGYPNVGKSSLINTLRRKSVCKVAPIPGETKVWQYVALTRSIFLIDCPGVIYDKESNNEVQAVLKGVVRIERLGNADKTEIIDTVLQIVKPKDIVATYQVNKWCDANDFIEQLAKLRGKLVSGGVPDVEAASRMVLYDWQRGRLPWFNAPPFESNKDYRDALEQPHDIQMKHIEHYSTFNIAELTITHAGLESSDYVDEIDETKDWTSKKRKVESKKMSQNSEATVATYINEKEEQRKKDKRREKRRAARELDGDHANGVSDADDDALWDRFLKAANA
ncbi:unnamed protein product [Phytomonas sp. Hart1]|nr:unnamed protein product [Phytomonas sp. Hart1]|eukprot:CCW69060.1 unnamed protein product [Phytomonas sp. isolate Hart1]